MTEEGKSVRFGVPRSTGFCRWSVVLPLHYEGRWGSGVRASGNMTKYPRSFMCIYTKVSFSGRKVLQFCLSYLIIIYNKLA